RKRAYCLKIQPATGSFARNLIYSTKPIETKSISELPDYKSVLCIGINSLKALPVSAQMQSVLRYSGSFSWQ
ncbi:hypothetical protein, partial [Raoultella planticola]|uniref:hypothetical protein n=1 Tax=Raoultella planticola TaxID=575 RepID=UPI003A4DFF04